MTEKYNIKKVISLIKIENNFTNYLKKKRTFKNIKFFKQ